MFKRQAYQKIIRLLNVVETKKNCKSFSEAFTITIKRKPTKTAIGTGHRNNKEKKNILHTILGFFFFDIIR